MKTMGKVILAVSFAFFVFFMLTMFQADPSDGPVCLPLKIFCTNVQP
jgi:hypothetical protein